ncbi:hypothetical protein [Erwinia phyllosphaerae]|uniref:hypothetical protein n=1 Tax=Erwinia phyllosphaerae TaxID=2853256 RepID=UPI001FEEB9E6|nr:hypothetical protein [Erwinia phyllosphaerae]
MSSSVPFFTAQACRSGVFNREGTSCISNKPGRKKSVMPKMNLFIKMPEYFLALIFFYHILDAIAVITDYSPQANP